MTRFVDVPADAGGVIPINPDLVRYLRPAAGGKVGIVFSGFLGGYDQVVTTLPLDEVRALLADVAASLVNTLPYSPTGAYMMGEDGQLRPVSVEAYYAALGHLGPAPAGAARTRKPKPAKTP